MLYAQIAESSVNAKDEPMSDVEDCVFLGETFSLTYVVHDVLAPFLSKTPLYQKCLHFPISSASIRHPGFPPVHDNQTMNQVNLLKEQGLFHRPSPKILRHMLDAYFNYFHYAYPIVEKSRFLDPAQAVQQSQLVLNSVLMIAATLCEEQTLKTAGLGDRHAARSLFYRQARCLYDADAEYDKLNNIRALFLMSFWWGGPNDVKDSWHWVGTAIIIAKSLGLHRTWV